MHMACHSVCYFTISNSSTFKSSKRPYYNKPVMFSSLNNTTRTASYNTLVYEAVRILGPPATFVASKLKVVTMREEEANKYSGVLPRTYILSHCDFTADLTLTISSIINIDQLKGWYRKDDVVVEWKKVKDDLCLHVHCFVSGPNPLLDLLAEFRYHIFAKEMPLVLQAVLYGDSSLFEEHPELMDAIVRVYFHSSSPKYNRMECWGPLKNAAVGKWTGQIIGLLAANEDYHPEKKRGKTMFQALFFFLLSSLLLVQDNSRG